MSTIAWVILGIFAAFGCLLGFQYGLHSAFLEKARLNQSPILIKIPPPWRNVSPRQLHISRAIRPASSTLRRVISLSSLAALIIVGGVLLWWVLSHPPYYTYSGIPMPYMRWPGLPMADTSPQGALTTLLRYGRPPPGNLFTRTVVIPTLCQR
jgi:hypothetical protein